MVAVRVVIDLPDGHAYHRATLEAVKHAAQATGITARVVVVPTIEVDDDFLAGVGRPGNGVIIGPGTPYRNPDAAHEVIRLARERGVPLVGT
jgi:CTP synthase (UTP-ammonia lyase)